MDHWSDSDDEPHSNVLLGIPDGKIETDADLIDAAVSRIGGLPALLPSNPPSFSSSSCKSCSKPMDLLVQLWSPFENSPMDRALYVWGCALVGCQGKDGSVRAWRGLRYNERYAEKLLRNQNKKIQSNPFTMTGDTSPQHNNPFTFSNTSIPSSPGPQDDDKSDAESDTDSLITALASTSIDDPAWKSAPSYPPLYLSTLTEYLPPQPKVPKGLDVEDIGEASWVKEKYEHSLELDHVFERFSQRVAIEGKQCIRYELGGSPLSFASDSVFDLLWPKPPSETLPITKPDFKVVRPSKRIYDPTQVPHCPSCNASRVFECQLMPNLINVLRPTSEDGEMSIAERRKQVEKYLEKSEANKDEKRGMEWGTCLIFSCEKDCCIEDGQEVKEVWREEVVYLQWDV